MSESQGSTAASVRRRRAGGGMGLRHSLLSLSLSLHPSLPPSLSDFLSVSLSLSFSLSLNLSLARENRVEGQRGNTVDCTAVHIQDMNHD
jgi:hypothetical protein